MARTSLSNQVTTFLDPKFWVYRRWILQQWKRCCSCKRSRHVRRAFHERNGETSQAILFFLKMINYILPKCLTHRITERTINYMYLEKKLLWISINFTRENSHSCLKLWCFPMFSRYHFLLFDVGNLSRSVSTMESLPVTFWRRDCSRMVHFWPLKVLRYSNLQFGTSNQTLWYLEDHPS